MSRRVYISLWAVATVVAAALASCKDDSYDNSPDGPLELSHSFITVGMTAQVVHIGVTARDEGWTMTGAKEWCRVDPSSGGTGVSLVALTFTDNSVDEGEDASTRTTTLEFTSGGQTKTIDIEQLATDIIPPNQNPESGVNQYIREQFLDTWYYNGETVATDADYNQSYSNFFENYLTYLTRNTLDGNTWAKNNVRYLYSYIDKNPAGTIEADIPPLGYGMEFDLAQYNGRLVGRILYVDKGSPAEKAGLRRGDWFYRVNDIQMQDYLGDDDWYQYNRRIDTLVNPVAGFSPKLGMLSFQPYAHTLTDEGRTVTLTPEHFHPNPILYSSADTGAPIVLAHNDAEVGQTRTGYLVYNSFDPDFRGELIDEFAKFKATAGEGGLTHFVLDLRYNTNGTVEMARLVGNLLVPEAARGMTFADYKFADGKASAHGGAVAFEPHANSVGVNTVFILTSGFTAGAAELLINALRGIPDVVKLVVIGDMTVGMSVGMVERTYRSDEWEYTAMIAAFTNTNNLAEGDYRYGFTPNGGVVNEWNQTDGYDRWTSSWGWKGVPGATEDPLLERALDFVVGNAIMPGGVIAGSTRQRPGFPREFSTPMYMTMDIPE